MSSGDHDARARALAACVGATLDAGGRALSLQALARLTGVSARMLVHHFGSKAGLDRAVIETVEARMRDDAMAMLARSGGALDAEAIMRSFREPARRATRTLFRTLLARGLGGDRVAVAVLRGERERWLALFRQTLGDDAAAARLMALVLGATLEAIFADLDGEERSAPEPGR